MAESPTTSAALPFSIGLISVRSQCFSRTPLVLKSPPQCHRLPSCIQVPNKKSLQLCFPKNTSKCQHDQQKQTHGGDDTKQSFLFSSENQAYVLGKKEITSLTDSFSHFLSLLLLNGSTILPNKPFSSSLGSCGEEAGKKETSRWMGGIQHFFFLLVQYSVQSVTPACPPGIFGQAFRPKLQRDSMTLPLEGYIFCAALDISHSNGNRATATVTRDTPGAARTAEVRSSPQGGSEFALYRKRTGDPAKPEPQAKHFYLHFQG